MNKIQAGFALFCLTAALPSQAQTRTWSGSARCDVTVTGTGYTDQLTHTWQTTGGATTQRGAFVIYPGTWSVSGGGSLDRTTGDQTLHAQWTRSVDGMSAPISVVTRASDGVVLIQADHAQLRGRGAVSGSQQVRRAGQVISSVTIAAEAFEHAFPAIKGNSTSTQLEGQATDTPKASFGYMQPGNSSVRVSCAWDFRRSDYTGGAPPNPATLPPPVTPPTTTPPVATPPVTPPTPPVGSGNPPPPPAQTCEELHAAYQESYEILVREQMRIGQMSLPLWNEYVALTVERPGLGSQPGNRLRLREIDRRMAELLEQMDVIQAEKVRVVDPLLQNHERVTALFLNQCPRYGNTPVTDPQNPQAEPGCDERVAVWQANYDELELLNERQYALLLEQNANAIAQLILERGEIVASLAVDETEAENTSRIAQVDVQIAQLEAERAALEREKIEAIAEIRRIAAQITSSVRSACIGAQP